MVSDGTRSRRAKNDEFSNSEGKPNSDKGGPTALSSTASESTTGLRRSSREALAKKGSAVSPKSIRKSERIGPPRSPGKPEEGGSGKRSASPTPLRRSDRGKTRSVSGDSSGAKKSDKSPNPLLAKNGKVQKEKTVMQLNLETEEVGPSGKVEVKPVKAGKKRGKKRLSSPAYKALFDRNKMQEREDKSSHGDSNNSRGEFDGIDQSSARRAVASVDKNARKSSNENLVVNELVKKADGRKEASSTSGSLNSVVKIKYVEPEIVAIDCSENEKEKGVDQVDFLTQGGTSKVLISFKKDQETNLSKRKRAVLDMDSDSKGAIVSKRVCASNAKAAAPLLASEGITCSPVEKCDLSSQIPRVELDSTREGHFSRNANLNLGSATPSLNKGRCELKANSTVGLDEKHNHLVQGKGSPRSFMPASEQYTCFTCKLGGKLLCCEGRGCKRSYHISCLDPPLDEVPLGVWYCLACVKKKLESGVHSVSEGVESIWEAKELEVIDVDGLLKKREYFVKYKGLAHIHNRWIPESELLLDAPSLLAKFNKKSQFSSWKQEWTIPHRLLQKRLLMFPKHCELYLTEHVGEKLDCHYEWLVKWVGLNYEHVTWELDNDALFKSPGGLHLMKDYENRHKRKTGASSSKVDKMPERESGKLDKLSQPQSGISSRASRYLMDFIDKLHEFWREDQNAVVIEEQANERFAKVISLLQSFQPNNCQPFLIISTSATLQLWDVEFLKLESHPNAVVYSGDKDLRKTVRKLEFYNEGGFIMFQVLVTTLEIVLEDLDDLRNIKWESIIIDEPQRTRISSHSAKIKLLDAERRLLLLSFQLKDNVAEYHNLLRLLESFKDSPTSNFLFLSDDIVNLKKKFSRYIAYGCLPDSSRFREYWVPIQMANLQLEQYCATLISNSAILFGTHKSNCAAALRDVVISSRKCCDHPYTVDQDAPARLSEGLQVSEYLKFGVNASGKFQFLDMMLSELKNQGLRALILFQELGKDDVGGILEDFVQQRFGKETYERIVAGIQPAKRNAALNNFNKDCSRFVFLIETRACLSSIKLSSVNTIIIFGSDWNPMNDMRALQRVTLDPPSEQIPVFRLYLSHTLEEKVLSLSKQEKFLDGHTLNMSWNTSHVLLMWGASHQFQSLEEFHRGAVTNSCSNPLSNNLSLEVAVKKKKESSLEHVVQEVLQIISSNCKDTKSRNSSIICSVQKVGGGYHTESSLPGELESQVVDEKQPNIFWTKLLQGKHPQWKFISGPTRRNRKKVQYSENEAVTEEVIKKRRRVVDGVDFPSPELGSGGTTPRCREGAFGTESLCRSPAVRNESIRANCAGTSPLVNNSLIVPQSNNFETEERRKLCEAQKSLHLSLKPGILELCKILKLKGNSEGLVKEFLEYMMSYHNVNSDSPTTMQAFQISLIWTVASMLNLKIDHKQSVAVARQHLNFNCRKEEAEFAYSMLRCFKTIFAYRTGNFKTDSLSSVAVSSYARDDVRICVNQIKKKCQKKLQNLIRKQEEEKERIMRNYEENKLQIQNRLKMNSMVICACFESNSSMKLVNLKQAETSSAKELEELENKRNIILKDLESRQLAERTAIQEKEAHWLDAVKSWVLPELFGKRIRNVSFNLLELLQNDEEVMIAEDIFNNGADNVSVSPPSSEEQIHNGLNMDVPEKVVQQEVPEMMCSSDRVEDLLSRDEPSAKTQDLDTTTPSMAVDEMSINNLEKEVQMEAQEIEQNPVSAGGLSQSTDMTTVVVSVNEVQLRVPGAVNANDGAMNVGSVSRLPSEEQRLDTAARNLPDKEIPSSVPQPSHQEVETAHSSEENNEICTVASNSSVDIDRQGSLNNAVGQSLPPELSQVNSSSLQMQPTTAVNDDNPVLPNQTHRNEGTVPSVSDGMQLEDSQTGDQQSASVSLDASPLIQSVHEATVSEPEAQEHLSPSSNLLPSDNSAGVPLNEDVQHLPSGENHAPSQFSQSPTNQSVHVATVSKCAAQELVLPSPNPLPGDNSAVVPMRGEILHLPSSENHAPSQVSESPANQSVNEATASEPAVQEHVSPPSNPLPVDNSAGVALSEGIQHLRSSENHASNQVSQPPAELSVNAPLVSNQPVLLLPGSSLPLNGLHVGPSGMHFSGSRTMTVASESNNRPAQPVTASITLMAAPPCFDPLQKELERLSNDFEVARKRHEDRKQELKSERDKEIEKVLAKINQKYELKHQEMEAEFLSQKNEYDERQSKVLLNKCLADAFRTKCTEIKMTSRLGAQPDVNGNLVQQMVHLPMQQNAVPHSLLGTTSTNPPSARLQARPPELNPRTTSVSIASVGARNAAPPAQAIAPPARPITGGRKTPLPPQTTVPPAVPITAGRSTPPALQTVRPSAVSPAPAARPPQISSVSYSNVAPQGSAQMSTRPPHLRSSSSSLATGTPPHLRGISTPGMLPSMLAPPRLPASTSNQSRPTDREPGPKTSIDLPNNTNLVSALDSQLSQASQAPPISFPSLSDWLTMTDQLNVSASGMAGARGNRGSTSGHVDVVYLSDDD